MIEYNEGDWIKIIDINSGIIIKAGKIVDIKKQGLSSFDHCLFFKNVGTKRYKVIENPEHLNIDNEIPSNYLIKLYKNNCIKSGDVFREYDITELDPEVKNLVFAINSIPGIITKGSCSGHSERRLWVTFLSLDESGLKILQRCINLYKKDFIKLYEVKDNKNTQRKLLTLRTKEKGPAAYEAANKLAKSITILTSK